MTDMKRLRDNGSEESGSMDRTTSSKRAHREQRQGVDLSRGDGETISSPKKLFDMEDALLFDRSSPPIPRKDVTLKRIKVGDWKKLRAFKQADLKVPISRATSIRAMMQLVAKEVADESKWQCWLSVFEDSITTESSFSKKVQVLAIRLAKSHPEMLFSEADWVNSKLVVTTLSSAWFAAIRLFGALYHEPPRYVYIADEKIFPIKQKLLEPIATVDIPPFSTEDLFKEVDGAHDVERKLRVHFGGGEWTVNRWTELFNEVIDDDKEYDDVSQIVYGFGIQLAKTDPAIFEGMWSSHYLLENSITKAWKGAINAYGSAWTLQAKLDIQKFLDDQETSEEFTRQGLQAMRMADDNESESSEDKQMEGEDAAEDNGEGRVDAADNRGSDPPASSIADGVSIIKYRASNSGATVVTNSSDGGRKSVVAFEASVVDASSSESKKATLYQRRVNSRFYLSKAKKQPHKVTPVETLKPAFSRKFTSYVKAKLPQFKFDFSHPESQNELAEYWQSFTDCLFKTDSKLVIYPWNLASSQDPLTFRSPRLMTKSEIEKFVERIFIKKGESAWIRLRIGHDKFVNMWDQDSVKQLFKDSQMFCYRDGLQCQKTACAGWLLGSHSSTNCKDLTEALKSMPEFTNLELEVRFHAIKIKAGSPRVSSEDLVKACHVYTEFRKIAEVKKALNKLYGHSNTSGYPLGKIMLFVPNTSDVRFPVSHKTVFYASRCMMKQKCFLGNTTTATSSDILGLDFVVEEIGISLRQAIMNIRHPEDPQKSLFISVDDSGYNTTFLFRNEDVVNEMARAIVPVLCIIMEEKYGPAAWNWFSDDAKVTSNGFFWDPIKQAVRSRDEPNVGDSTEEIDEALFHFEPGVDESFGETYHLNILEFRDIHIEFLDDEAMKQQFSDWGSTRSFRSACNLSMVSGADSSFDESQRDNMEIEATRDGQDSLEETSNPSPENLSVNLHTPNGQTPREVVAPTDPTATSSLSASAHSMSFEQFRLMMDAYPAYVQTILSQRQTSPASDPLSDSVRPPNDSYEAANSRVEDRGQGP